MNDVRSVTTLKQIFDKTEFLGLTVSLNGR